MRTGARAWTTDALVLLGTAGSLGLMAVTALLNFRFGFKLGGSDEVERQLFAWGLACADVVKALMPFSFTLAVRKKDWLGAVASAAIFAIASVSSFYAGVGLGAEHRFANEGTNTGIIDRRKDLSAEKERLEARLKQLGPVPSSAVAEKDLEAAFAKPVGSGEKTLANYTDRCRKGMVKAREACARVAELGVRLELAKEAERIVGRLGEIQEGVKNLDSGVRSADPQLDVLERVAIWARVNVARDDIRTGLLLLLGLLFELGSGLGLYAVTAPWRHGDQGPERKRMTTVPGDGVVYADERLVPVRGARLTANEVYADYEDWCLKHNYVPVREGIFTEQLIVLAKEIGVPLEQSGSNLSFCDVGVSREPVV